MPSKVNTILKIVPMIYVMVTSTQQNPLTAEINHYRSIITPQLNSGFWCTSFNGHFTNMWYSAMIDSLALWVASKLIYSTYQMMDTKAIHKLILNVWHAIAQLFSSGRFSISCSKCHSDESSNSNKTSKEYKTISAK